VIQPSKSQPENGAVAPVSNLQRLWEHDGFALTLQLPPIFTPQAQDIIARAARLIRGADAVLVADAPDGMIALSSIAVAVLFERAGLPTIVQIHGRDKNRLALQGEILGLGALNIPNVLVDTRTVSRASLGRHADARLVGDLDGPTLLATAARLRDKARFLSGASIKAPPAFYLGALIDLEEPLLSEKLMAAQFLVTAPLSDYQSSFETLSSFLAAHADFLRSRPLLVSVPFAGGSRAEYGSLHAHAGGMDEERLGEMVRLLQRLPGVRGCNIVIQHLDGLAMIERTLSSDLFHLERRE